MALPGMKSTADFAADEHPKSWREGILRLSPRNNAPLYALTSMMKSERTTFPQYYWWEEPLFMYTFELNGDLLVGTTTIPLVEGGLRLKAGDVLKIAATGEHIRVASVTSDTSIEVSRAFGDAATTEGTAAAVDTASGGTGSADATLIFIGSAYREGADKAIGTSTQPVKQYNYTQIFRDPVEHTRTTMQSSGWRTGDPMKNDKERTAHKHALGIERAFWFGGRMETTESGQPIRTTGGITSFIDSTKEWNLATDNNGTAGATDLELFESKLAEIFEFGSSEKMGFTSIQVIALMSRLARLNSQYEISSTQKEYGLDVRRFFGPAGTIVLKEHPAFSATDYLRNDIFIIDTANIRYRHLQDTTYLRNRQGNGVDGKTDEFLTEAGLEVHHGKTHYRIRGLTAVAADA